MSENLLPSEQIAGILSKSNKMLLQEINPQFRQKKSGFTMLELIITCTLVGVLSSVAIINLSPAVNKERLKSTARSIENWINQQRALAMQHGLTCEIQIDQSQKTLTSQVANSIPPKSCDLLLSDPSILNINEEFKNGSNHLSISFQSLISDPSKPTGVRFSFRGFSENFNINSSNSLEIRLSHKDLETQRCIKIASPIGLIRDGYTTDSMSPCTYNQPF